MYRAKSAGKARYMTFDSHMRLNVLDRLTLEADLRQAVERNELRVHFQPIVHLLSEQVREVEALVRWQHPERGLIGPAEFIPIAEETGLIISIGRSVLQTACQQAAIWQDMFPQEPPLQLSVNLSPRQFEDPSLVGDVMCALRLSAIQPGSLKLEVTESIIMRDTEASIHTLHKLKAQGIKIAIDDFGTGYSSLSYLKALPLDVLKIDRSFVKGIGTNAEDDAIVQAIISLARSLDLDVTAEGIETDAQAARLREWSCESGQGFLFSKPLQAAQMMELLRNAEQPYTS
jgi:EAL domain-containing protein (putative c-di-GMP-specific phosphodiesterase class I)